MITQQERLEATERQIQRLQQRMKRLDKQSNHYGWIRVYIFFAGLIISVAIAFFTVWWVGILFFLLALLAFSLVATYQQRLDRSLTRHRAWLHIKETEVARMRLDWNSIPDAYTPEQQTEHPFEIDLDITGKHSLHRLINTAISTEGTQLLRRWLLTVKPHLETIQARWALVEELIPMAAFRTRLTMKALLAARKVSSQLEGQRLQRWLDEQKKPTNLPALIVMSHLLTFTWILLLLLNLLSVLPQFWIFALIVDVLFVMVTKEKRGNLFDDAYYLRDAIAQFNAVFTYLETYRYGQNVHVRQLCTPYFASTSRPSQLLKQFQSIATGATLERNGLVWLLINLLLPWDFYLAWRFNRYRDQLTACLPTWLDTWFELEALSSLATFAYLHPEYVRPNLYETADSAHPRPLCVRGVGHPLLAVESKVVNDFTMERVGEIVIITGSNMAGKSTFLRTLGVNLCLAYAGAPVNAASFDTELFRLFTCIKISDSVTEGYSYFYAEVRRLRALLDELADSNQEMPLFFLIDEIFRGTNNRERRIGSEAYIQALSGQHSLGLLSTHDLELVKLADLLPQVENYHFKEDVINGQMTFDYILRHGPCPTTNALKIMEMEGLPIHAVNTDVQ